MSTKIRMAPMLGDAAAEGALVPLVWSQGMWVKTNFGRSLELVGPPKPSMCQGCGAPHEPDRSDCSYCGRER